MQAQPTVGDDGDHNWAFSNACHAVTWVRIYLRVVYLLVYTTLHHNVTGQQQNTQDAGTGSLKKSPGGLRGICGPGGSHCRDHGQMVVSLNVRHGLIGGQSNLQSAVLIPANTIQPSKPQVLRDGHSITLSSYWAT